MPFNAQQKQRVSKYLANFDFKTLFFEELGWDRPPTGMKPLPVPVDDHIYTLSPIAQKREFYIFKCTNEDGELPPPAVRNRIETWLSKRNREHLIVFVDETQTTQVWQWVRRQPGQQLRRRNHRYEPSYQAGESLVQKLENLYISFVDEEDTTLVDVVGKAWAAFNVERATRRFYDQFKKERNAFEEFVTGIGDAEDEDWYVSVMLNRLMFIYFIQRKGFLDGDPEYLRNRLRHMQAEHGQDRFYTFYRYFLLRLFHDGLGNTERTPELDKLLGAIPYLNGGIFQLHEVEQRYPDIQIKDDAFERILDFFDHYQWHLDDRPLRDDSEINPDVLGYIFEKYVNQKQMGAYYTKEDITQYISQNTVIPYLFDAAKEKCRTAFDPEGPVWTILREDPDRYIYEAVAHGCDLTMPEEIAVGVDDVGQRGKWNTRTPEEFGLPTEIWRETVARRQRYEEAWLKVAGGEISEINDLITYNLDIKQFAQDVIEQCEGADLLNAFWSTINSVTVLDPTCGSGAFLFAALNILQPLYEACIDRMADFLEEPGFVKLHPIYAKRFQAVLDQIEQHPNRTYYVLKTIMVNNLYGVDIMEEAVEICKLRFFLKLAGQVDKQEGATNMGIEPLPDIDFNIRAGNTLVGFATLDEVRQTLLSGTDNTGVKRKKLLLTPEDDKILKVIEEGAQDVDRLFKRFREQQTVLGGEITAGDKQVLQKKLKAVEDSLNRYLSQEYGVDLNKKTKYDDWLSTHQPFHWFTEFYGIVYEGDGFDVIIGNPPFVEYAKVKRIYRILGYETEKCGNLHAFMLERSYSLMADNGRLGIIVPMSAVSSRRMDTLQQKILLRFRTLWLSHFSERPAQLFTGSRPMLTIVVGAFRDLDGDIYSTTLHRWYSETRRFLFEQIVYASIERDTVRVHAVPKLGKSYDNSIIKKLLNLENQLGESFKRSGSFPVLYNRSFLYWFKSFTFYPDFFSEGTEKSESDDHQKTLFVSTQADQSVISGILNSSLMYWYTIKYSNGRESTRALIFAFPFDATRLDDESCEELESLSRILMEDLKINSKLKTTTYKGVGKIAYQEFFFKPSKSIIDRIDRVLAGYYGFSVEELDFIINYDIKFRMGEEL